MLNGLDIGLLVILGLSALLGVWRGFLTEVMALGIWVAAFWLSFAYGSDIAELYVPVMDGVTVRWVAGYVSVFLVTLILGGLVSWLLRKLIASTGLSGTDRLLGLGFGLLRGAALGCALVLIAGFSPLPQEPVWEQSLLIPGFERGAEWMKQGLPESVAERISFDPLQKLLPLSPIPGENMSSGAKSSSTVAPSSDSSTPVPSPPRS